MEKKPIVKRKINFEDFDLVKVKLKDYGLDVKWCERGSTDEVLNIIKQEQPHDDLIQALNELKPLFAQRLGLTKHLTEIRAKTNGTGNILVVGDLIKMEEKQIDECSISGIFYAGQDQMRRIGITGSFKVPVYGSSSLAAPAVNLASDKLGYEDELDELCENIRKQVYNFMFLGHCKPKAHENQMRIDDEAARIAHEEAEEGLRQHREEQAKKEVQEKEKSNQESQKESEVLEAEKPVEQLIKEKAEKKNAANKKKTPTTRKRKPVAKKK